MPSSLHRRVAPWPLLLALLLAACAATTVDGTWTRPETAGRRIEGPVLVVGVARDETVRRIYEDDMAAKLAARGIEAVRSYEVVRRRARMSTATTGCCRPHATPARATCCRPR
jgi:hypothetical protein